MMMMMMTLRGSTGVGNVWAVSAIVLRLIWENSFESVSLCTLVDATAINQNCTQMYFGEDLCLKFGC